MNRRGPYHLVKQPGETVEQARARADCESAARAREAGLGDLICNDCDRLKAACYRDLKTCELRQEMKRSYPRLVTKGKYGSLDSRQSGFQFQPKHSKA